jgi:phosphoglycerate dehydrogenase-like enzyme
MNEKKNILVILPIDEAHKNLLRDAAPDTDIVYVEPGKASTEQIERANAIIGYPSPKMMIYAKNLEWLQLASAGVDHILKGGVLPQNVLLTNASGCYGLAISEYMMGMVLSLFLNLPLYKENQLKHFWHDEGTVKSIFGSTALIVGLGDIGGEFAKRFKSLGGHTIGIRRTGLTKPDYLDELYLIDQLDELLPRADVVTLSLPETPQTHKLFGKEKFALMKPGSILLNVGRGKAIDTDALCDVLNSGQLGGAAIDVTDPEPLPPEHPIWDAKNILITPHVSGNFNLPETYERVLKMCADNLGRYLRGEQLNNLVDFSTGYKKHD